MIALFILDGLILLLTLAAWGLSGDDLVRTGVLWFGLTLLGFFSLMLLIAGVVGLAQMRSARKFLDSERVLVRWTYSHSEWQRFKEIRWQKDKKALKDQVITLMSAVALMGVTVGVWIGWGQGIRDAVLKGLAGLLAGGLAGSLLGPLLAAGDYWVARRLYKRTEPGEVALGVDEIFAGGDYFRVKGKDQYVRSIKLQTGPAAVLEIQLLNSGETQWTIPVPAMSIEQVEAVLPRLVKRPVGEEDSGLWGPRVR
jgi:hypothetical protein